MRVLSMSYGIPIFIGAFALVGCDHPPAFITEAIPTPAPGENNKTHQEADESARLNKAKLKKAQEENSELQNDEQKQGTVDESFDYAQKRGTVDESVDEPACLGHSVPCVAKIEEDKGAHGNQQDDLTSDKSGTGLDEVVSQRPESKPVSVVAEAPKDNIPVNVPSEPSKVDEPAPEATPTPVSVQVPIFFEQGRGDALYTNCLKVSVNGGEFVELGCNKQGDLIKQVTLKAYPQPHLNVVRLAFSTTYNSHEWTRVTNKKEDLSYMCIKQLSQNSVQIGYEDTPNGDFDMNDYVVKIGGGEDLKFTIEGWDGRSCPRAL